MLTILLYLEFYILVQRFLREIKVRLDSETAGKQGKSSCYSVFALVAFGDCSIKSAMKDGGITKIHHVDSKSTQFLFIMYRYDTIVYGE